MWRNPFRILILALIAGACAEEPVEEPYTTNSAKLQNLSISTGELNPPFDPLIKNYSISSINSLTPVSISVKRFTPKASIKFNGTIIPGDKASFFLEKGKDVIIDIKFRDSLNQYKVSWIPPNFPRYTVNQSSVTARGNVFFAQLNSDLYCYAVVLDNTGIPMFYRKVDANLLGDFKKHITTTGMTRYSYLKSNPSVTQVIGGFQGSRVILDENFNQINSFESLIVPAGQTAAAESHDFILIDENHFIITSYVIRQNVDLTAYGGATSVALVELWLQEVRNGSVLLEWRSSDFPEFIINADDVYKAQYSSAGPVDYFHFNSICIDPLDNNLILSARHTNQVFKINRTTGQILWRLGGKTDEFNLSPELKFSHQHHVTRLQNGNLLMFDNGNGRIPQQTRILEFQLNENSRSAILAWQYQEPGRFSSFMGSAQRLANGNTLIGWGGAPAGTSQPDRSDITEVTPDGNVVFDLSFENKPSNQFSYRAFRY